MQRATAVVECRLIQSLGTKVNPNTMGSNPSLGTKLFMFVVVGIVGVAVVQATPTVQDLITEQLSVIRAFLKLDGIGIAALINAVLYFSLLSIILPLVIFVPFLIFEIVYGRSKKNHRVVVKSFVFKVTGLAIVAFIGLLLTRVDPRRYVDDPVLVLNAGSLGGLTAIGSSVLIAVLALIVYDLAVYVAHYAQHKFAFLWRFHAVHHSIHDLDSLNSYTHPVDFVGQWIVMVAFAVLCDFRYEQFILLGAFKEAHERFLHTNMNLNFGFMKNILIDNRHHFLHHSIRREDYDTNFAAYFTLWDRVFGTYRSPAETLGETGVVDLQEPRNVTEYLTASLKAR